jgi:hypothetical protein
LLRLGEHADGVREALAPAKDGARRPRTFLDRAAHGYTAATQASRPVRGPGGKSWGTGLPLLEIADPTTEATDVLRLH